MLYLLDTNIISYLLEGRKDILEKFVLIDLCNDIKIPDIVYYEIRRGLLYRDSKNLLKSFDDFCLHYGILSMTKTTMQIAAENYAYLRKLGQIIEDSDILIGSLSVEHNAVLVTNNSKHLSRIKGINIVEW